MYICIYRIVSGSALYRILQNFVWNYGCNAFVFVPFLLHWRISNFLLFDRYVCRFDQCVGLNFERIKSHGLCYLDKYLYLYIYVKAGIDQIVYVSAFVSNLENLLYKILNDFFYYLLDLINFFINLLNTMEYIVWINIEKWK